MPGAEVDTGIRSLFSTLQHGLWLFPLLACAGFFSGTETALLSLSLPQREALRQAKDSASRRILWLLSNPRRLITTIILGNELTNILLSELMTDVVTGLWRLFPSTNLGIGSRDALIALVATFLTVPALVTVGELIPKTIGIKIAERWSRAVSGPTMVLTYALALPRLIISGIAAAVLWLFGQRPQYREGGAPVLSQTQLRTLVDLGSAEGELKGPEAQLIHNVLDFGDTTVGEIMTPAKDVFALPMDLPLSRLVESVARQRYSRVPMYRGRRDNVQGIVFAKDLVGYSYGDLEGRPLVDLLHPALFVPRRAKCDRVFREFQRRRIHIAMVVDEYGRLAGLVTMEDLLHSLFGDLAKSGNELPAVPQSEPPAAGAEAAAAGAAEVFAIDTLAADALAGPPLLDRDPIVELNAEPTTPAKERSSEDLSGGAKDAASELLPSERPPTGDREGEDE